MELVDQLRLIQSGTEIQSSGFVQVLLAIVKQVNSVSLTWRATSCASRSHLIHVSYV